MMPRLWNTTVRPDRMLPGLYSATVHPNENGTRAIEYTGDSQVK